MGAASPGTDGQARARLEHALLLIARIHGGDTGTAAAARSALARWRDADPAHEAAFQRAQAGWQATRADTLRGTLPLPERAGMRRRQALTLLGLAGVALGCGALLHRHRQQPLQQLALRTPRGQQAAVALADGSRLRLDANTEARVRLYRDRREVWLDAGEIRLAVSPDAQRPLIVATPWGHARVLGTVFTAEARHGRMRIAVAEGRVAVWPDPLAPDGVQAALARADGTMLAAGQSIDSDGAALSPVRRVPVDAVGAWRQGWLVFDATPLAEAVARWNDHLATPLLLDPDPTLRALRLTGSYPLRAPAQFADSLPATLPVRVTRQADGVLRIQARR